MKFKHSFQISKFKFQILGALLALGTFVAIFYSLTRPASAAWFDELWAYRNAIPITSHTAAENNVYVSTTLDTSTAGQFQSDCGDLRFTTQSGDLLPYYISSGCGTATTVVHVFFDSFPAGAQTLYYYYGNPSAANGFSSSDFSTQATNYVVGTVASQEKSAGPVAYWSFDSGYGTVAQDATQNNNDGTITGATWQTEDQCISGKCLKFDGTNDNVQVADNDNFSANTTNQLSVETWIKLNSLNARQSIISKGNTGKYEWDIRVETTGQILIYLYNPSGSTSYMVVGSSTGAINANRWYHIAFTVNTSTPLINLFLNGINIGSSPTTSGVYTNDTATVNIGERADGANDVIGYIDDVKIYPYARTAAQIKADYRSRGTTKGSAATLSSSKGQGDFLSNGLVGYWKMDEASWTNDCTATSVTDSSGNANNGKACPASTGPTGGATGKFGNGGIFDGSDDYVEVGGATNLNLSTITISAWIKPNGAQNSYDRILEKNYTTSYYLGLDSTGTRFKGIFANSSAPYGTLDSSTTFSSGTWYHVVITHNGTTDVLYVNGIQEATQNNNVTLNESATIVKIGRQGPGATGYFTGSIDDVRIYNRALSGVEVRALYSWAPGPVGYWNFEEGQGTSVADRSGNANTGTWAGTGTTHWTSGKYGKAGYFNGTDDDVNFGTSSLFDMGLGNMTLEAWASFPSVGSNYGDIIGKGGWNNALSYGIVNNAVGANCVIAYLANTATPPGDRKLASDSACTAVNTWHHYAATFNRSGNMILYVDGIQKAATDISSYSAINFTNASSLLSGSYPGWFTNAIIDDVRIYNYARTQKQIVEDMNAGHPAPGSPVGSAIGYWKFDEGYGGTTYDSGTQKVNGTLSGTAPTWTNSGKFGKALSFGGAGYVSLGNISAYKTDSKTISFWANPTTVTDTTPIVSGSGPNWYTGFATSGRMITSYKTTAEAQQVTYSNNSAVTNGAWHHYSYVFNVSGSNVTISFYVDGVLNSSASYSTGYSATYNSAFILGAYNSSSLFYTGLLDEVKIYNSALTAEEIKLDYNRGSSMVLGALGSNASYAPDASNQQYCVPGDSTSCAAPVGEWNFEEKTGGSTNDSSGNGSTGTWNGTGTHWGQGKYGAGAVFNYGNSDWINLGSPSSLQITGSISFAAWVNITSYSVYNEAIGKSNNTFSNRSFELRTSITTGLPQTFVYAGGSCAGYGTADTVALSKNMWHHLESVYDSSAGTLKLYVDGTLRGTNTSITGNICNSTQQLAIGALGYFTGGTGFNGKIDQVRIYNYARTAAQVAWDYNRGGPVGWWKFDECQGATANDSSGNNLSGTIASAASLGTCTSSAGDMWKDGATGKFNSSLDFDNTVSDNVQVADNNILRITDELSVCAWVKSNGGSTSIGIFEKTVGDLVNTSYLLFGETTAYKWRVKDATGIQTLASNTTLTTLLNSWAHVCGTFSKSNSGAAVIYINGKSDNSTNFRATSASTGAGTSYIGVLGKTGGVNIYPYSGQIDDVRVYNYALTATQIKQLFNEGSAVRFGPSTGTP